jgi:MSHA pilin protein MshD
MSVDRHQRGFTLIELIVFIVIVSAALAGVLTILNQTTRSSADPMIRKQALAVAEALLEEVMAKPFTWCDPDDAQAATALSAVVGPLGCTVNVNVEALGAEAGEVRDTFDNVNDYNGLSTAVNIAGGGAAPYNAVVAVAATDLNGITAASANALLVTVTVNAPNGEAVQLQGIRTRHSPNLLP